MGAWGRDQKTAGKVRMMADGSADFRSGHRPRPDLTAKGMGLRSQRYSMLVVDGVVKSLNVEAPGKFEVSDANTCLRRRPLSECERCAALDESSADAAGIIPASPNGRATTARRGLGSAHNRRANVRRHARCCRGPTGPRLTDEQRVCDSGKVGDRHDSNAIAT